MTKTLEDLRALYTSELEPVLADIRMALRAAKGRAWRLFFILFPVLCVAGFLLMGHFSAHGQFVRSGFVSHHHSTAGFNFFPVGVALIGSALIASIYHAVCRGKQTARFKDIIIQKMLGLVAPEMRYDRKKYIPERQFGKSGIYTSSIDRYSGEDYFYGKYEGVDLVFSEVHAEKKVSHRDSDGKTHTHYETIFKGVFFIADFNKDFRTSTLVIPTTAERTFGGTIGTWIKKMGSAGRGALVKLENPEFEKMFAVYAQDAIEARYILTPNIMERMMAIQRRFPGDVAFAFHASSIYIAIPLREDFFEPPRALDFSGVAALYHQLALFFDLVQEMNLTHRIWTKV